ncbi:glycosyl transferase [Methyloprofundus sedimenti]|uniref:Glycosyl transferase n=1 Tax=Methyloprofundus sedimenti TaxID=1420851 RepID=A0A1V8M1P5_9GAMM|nr:glycosyltransferase family A protein [Methyloprofundus sedimenti]OQK15343.1 glycosyl transferase [Methyloprofundus sedimenti]
MEISLIIPTYNRCLLLKRALQSVLEQSRPPDEIIIVDDGSTDNTLDMLNDEFPQLTIIKQSNKGVSTARNIGIQQSRGNWIAFLDSDDSWLAEKLTTQIRALQQAPELKICHTEETWIRNGVRVNAMHKHKKTGGWIFEQCLPLCTMSPSSIMIHRSVFDDVGLFDENLPACEDYDLWLRISAKYPVLFLEQPLINKYGGHEDQLSHKYWGMDRFRIQALEKIISQPDLSVENKHSAIKMLLKKARIFRNGALKRDKIESAQYYQQLLDKYQ